MSTDTVPVDPTTTPAPRRASRAALAIGVSLGLLGALYGAYWFADAVSGSSSTSETSYAAAETVELVADGHVTVSAADGGAAVDVRWLDRSGLREPEHDVVESTDRLVVTSECTGWLPSLCRGSLEVHLPADTELVVRTSNGEIRAAGIRGDADLETSNGAVIVGDLGGDVRAETSNGQISAADLRGSLTAETSNGEIDVARVQGDVRVSTSNGSVWIGAVDGNVQASSSNGDITVRGGTDPVALTMETSNGERIVEGATDPGAERRVEIETSNGDVAYYGTSGNG